MKIYMVEEMIFYPLFPEYLIYICKKDEYDQMTREEFLVRVAKALELAGVDKRIVH